MDGANPQITVLVDCHGLSPLRIPVKIMRHCCNILQDHFPNVLGGLIIIRLPSVVRVISQTFLQVSYRPKLHNYHHTLCILFGPIIILWMKDAAQLLEGCLLSMNRLDLIDFTQVDPLYSLSGSK